MTAGRFEIVLPELDNFEKAEKLAFLWAPETGRATGQAAIVGILANPAFACVLPTVLSAEEVRDHRRRSARSARRIQLSVPAVRGFPSNAGPRSD